MRIGLAIVLAGIGLFLSAWIILPPPNFFLLRLAVGAPEISPVLIVINAIALLLLLATYSTSPLKSIALVCATAGLAFSALPLVQLPSMVQQANGALEQIGIKDSPLTRLRSQPFVLLDVFRGIPIPPTRRVQTIQFTQSDGIPLSLNLYRPTQVGKYPAIVVIHGGGWQNGSPNDNAQFSQYMAAQGYSVVSIDYRRAPQHRFPAQLEDVRTAIAYIREHADELEVDVNRMALMGRSAGAHLAMLAAYEPDAPPIRAVVNYYGPVNLTTGYQDPPNPDPIGSRGLLRDFLGGTPADLPELYQQASPWNYVNNMVPSSLLIYGHRDHVVQSKFGRKLYDRLEKTGNQAIFLEIPWAEHAFDAIFQGVSSQVALYYTERFLAWALK
ncbi:MAG: alpha/beta hydrolase [Timaviella obliquedivisa GSE-PSE-MK23-08B]|jgi:acetyl esterase/lipase|nr:alpha/beta hydrolase [Timaviella obliquedivisa GSE-PSE-MK23-08B]